MSIEDTPVGRTLAAYAAAVNAKDVDAFAALYDDDVHIFDSWGQWQYSGIDEWRAMATGWFESLGDETVEVGFADLRSTIGDDVAFGHAAVTFTGISATGERQRAMTNRLSIGLQRKDGAWRVVHEHTSLPIDLESGSAIFSR
ncbi:YybH family protein [Lacisediminihabitans profunda]|uniref:SgcJ/EcaC family oxidoreductase n=1 Tax=Lacisediminihabitans profunda TaxID=2594790 RepID=A0A5C8URF1_9MICO|nr:SgcJ/EcaC family oxidoreductase [Lacisediminihabitans profunda]TXN30049.1 SgcJ/EcaC family oxidoreductase [Lacisediminihabitans profunda]